MIRLPGEVENAGTLFAHSFVFCVVEVVNAFDDRASRRGDVIPLLVTSTDFVSAGCNRDVMEGVTPLEESLSSAVSIMIALSFKVGLV